MCGWPQFPVAQLDILQNLVANTRSKQSATLQHRPGPPRTGRWWWIATSWMKDQRPSRAALWWLTQTGLQGTGHLLWQAQVASPLLARSLELLTYQLGLWCSGPQWPLRVTENLGSIPEREPEKWLPLLRRAAGAQITQS